MAHYVLLKPHSGNLKLDNPFSAILVLHASDVEFSHMPFLLFTLFLSVEKHHSIKENKVGLK